MILALLALTPFLGAGLAFLMGGAGRMASAGAALAATLLALLLLLGQAPAVFSGEIVRAGVDWVPSLGLRASLFVDPLGFMFASLILGIGLLIVIYAQNYLGKGDSKPRFFGYLLLFQGAMLGIVISDNVLMLLVFWELTSLSSFLLIGFWQDRPESRQGARLALAITGGGGLALMAGLLILGSIVGSYELSTILQNRELIQASPLYLPALLLILLGCFAKSAQFPFHFWLPHAMAAPTPVSAYLHSATMVKAGVFLLARLWPVLAGTEAWFYIVTLTGLTTLLIGAAVALFKDDLKALLAYSTISHLGLLTMLLGFGTPMAAVTAVFHVLNHAAFKAALFMNAGIVDHETHTRDIKQMGGLAKLMPISAGIAVLAGGAMAGLPPLNGFISKEMMLEEALHTPVAGQAWLLPALTGLGALLSAAYSLRYIWGVYFAPAGSAAAGKPHDPPPGLWGPSGLLAIVVVAVGLAPALIAGPLVLAASGAVIGATPPEFTLKLWHGFAPALFISLGALAGGALLLRAYPRVLAVWSRLLLPDAKRLFETGLDAARRLADLATRFVHDGSLQRQLAWIVGASVVVAAIGFSSATYGEGTRELLPASAVAILAFLLLATAAGLVVLRHRHRLEALIFMSVIGLIVGVAFVYLSAPDLALTQITVEVVTILLLLLALNLLPKETPKESHPVRRARDGAIAIAGGLGLGAVTWAALTRPLESISAFHWANSYSGGGGTNVVNVILVDFRGFDTFGEIIVLGIAALGIFALLEPADRGEAGRRLAAWRPDQARSPERHPLMLVVATRLLLPLALAAGLYIFLRGHNQPGGGFIAGLVVSIALIMQYLASGWSWAARRMRFDHHVLIGAGVLIAGGTGMAAMALGAPFLTSWFDYFHPPLIGEIELASAMAFDVGVAFTVIGAVVLALAQLSRVGQRAERLRDTEAAMDIDPRREEEPHS
ncbi:MAG: monovalent cation/H+ antiporter subunit A [Phenylobacterium sp.]|uniref:monovalent cation/H+ antiporter subunit A n=1 Tax=Phenylobacterium sp. TaxID=1871053 RepID=UPI00391D308B